MNGVVYFVRMFQYTEWADRLCLDGLAKLAEPPARAHLMLSHSVAASVLWYNRLQGKEFTMKLWEPVPLNELEEIARGNMADWQRYLETLRDDELENRLAYHTTSGVPYETALRDIFAHVVNHATHHRGQAVNIIREAGHTPPATDYVFYVREMEKGNPGKS